MYQVASTGAKKGHHTEKGGLHQVLYLKNTADATNEQFLFRKREVLCWLLGTSVRENWKVAPRPSPIFHITFTKRYTAKQCEVKQSPVSSVWKHRTQQQNRGM